MIGILDSGIGGVTVLREIIKKFPVSKFIYYSDSLNNPYGDKEFSFIYACVKKAANYLLDRGCKVVVLACNTASFLCLDKLKEEYPKVLFVATFPPYQMVDIKKTLVMATVATLKSERFLKLYQKYDNHNTVLVPCSGLADLIEMGNDLEIDKYLFKHLSKYKGVSNVFLGCTHYPLVKDKIKKVLGDVNFYDGASFAASELEQILKHNKIEYQFAKLTVEFVDSSNDSLKRERFFEYLGKNI